MASSILCLTPPPHSSPTPPLEQRCVGRGVCADRAFSIKLAWGMVAVDWRVPGGRQAVSFAYSLSQGHSQQARILPIHHGTRIMCGGILFPLPNSLRARGTKVVGELQERGEWIAGRKEMEETDGQWKWERVIASCCHNRTGLIIPLGWFRLFVCVSACTYGYACECVCVNNIYHLSQHLLQLVQTYS